MVSILVVGGFLFDLRSGMGMGHELGPVLIFGLKVPRTSYHHEFYPFDQFVRPDCSF